MIQIFELNSEHLIIRATAFSFILLVSSLKTSRIRAAAILKLVLQYYNHLALGDYLSNRPHFLSVYRRNNPRGMLGEHDKSLEITSRRRVLYKNKRNYFARQREASNCTILTVSPPIFAIGEKKPHIFFFGLLFPNCINSRAHGEDRAIASKNR